MLKKPKHKIIRKKSVYDKYTRNMPYSYKLLLHGTSEAMRRGLDGLDISYTRSALLMFYLYLVHKYKDKKDASTLCTFMHKYFFRSTCDKKRLNEYSLSEVRKNFIKYYDYYAKDMEDNTILCTRICNGMKCGKIEYSFSYEYKTLILKHVENYIDFLELHCLSQTLGKDDLLDKITMHRLESKHLKNPPTKTSKEDIRRRAESQIFEHKLTFFTNAILLAKKDLNLYLKDAQFNNVRSDIKNAFSNYEYKLQKRLHYKYNHSEKSRTHKDFFETMNKMGMNWICSCTQGAENEKYYFYTYVYDIVMYKFKLLTYFQNNEENKGNKKRQDEILSKLETGHYDKREMRFDFFTRTIQKEGDINAHIIKLFPKDKQRFITNLLAVGTRTNYKDKDRYPIYASVATLFNKSAPVESLKLFALPPSKKK